MPRTPTTTQRSPQSNAGGATEAIAEGAPDAQTSEARVWQDDPETREALIRLAAYSFHERRGFADGLELEDWLQAGMEIDRRTAAGAGAGGGAGEASPTPN